MTYSRRSHSTFLRPRPAGLSMLFVLACSTGCPGDDLPEVPDGDDTTGTTGTVPSTITTPTVTMPDPDTSATVGMDSGTTMGEDTTVGADTTVGVDSSTTSSAGVCGDDVIDEGEDCDGTDLGGSDCVAQGFGGGDLACADDCTFDTSACIPCGNGMIDEGEDCDGDDLGGLDCVGLDPAMYMGGTLACSPECTYDVRACEVITCGDDVIDGMDVCDGTDLGGQDCATQGFDGGTLACEPGCAAFDTTGCYACGDGVIGGPEVCDGADLGGADCVTQGFDGGTLACAADCSGYDTSACTGGATILLMGDDTTDPAEWDIYRNALTAAGYAWDEHNLDTTPFPSAMQLAGYDTLVWFDEGVITAGDAEAQLVADWLVAGPDHNLWVTGVDFLWDFENGGVGTGEDNLYQLWNTPYQGDYAGTTITVLEGVAGDPITDPFAAPGGLTLSGNASSNGDFANPGMGTATGAAFYGPGGAGSGFAGITHWDSGTYQVVWMGVSFHASLTDAAQRDLLAANILTWLGA